MTEENKQKPVEYRFIKSTKQGENWVAIMADQNVIGEAGVNALRSAAMTDKFNQIRIREGVHFMDAERLEMARDVCMSHGMNDSAAALKRAMDVVNEKNGNAPAAKAAVAANKYG